MTTKAKSTEHAKGPWQAIKFPNLPWAVYETGPHELIVCQVSNPDWSRDEANARLIAAAPELLDACRAAIDEAEDVGGGDVRIRTEIVDLILQAIAKAEGR